MAGSFGPSRQRTFFPPQRIAGGVEVEHLAVVERVRHVRSGFLTSGTLFIGQGGPDPEACQSCVWVWREGSRCHECANVRTDCLFVHWRVTWR
jgi:hypothetical protein